MKWIWLCLANTLCSWTIRHRHVDEHKIRQQIQVTSGQFFGASKPVGSFVFGRHHPHRRLASQKLLEPQGVLCLV